MFILKTILETAACVLLILGYLNEEKVIAFERRLWKNIRKYFAAPAQTEKHSATYTASREGKLQEPRRVA